MSVPPLHPGLHPGHEEVNHHREEVFWNIAVRFELGVIAVLNGFHPEIAALDLNLPSVGHQSCDHVALQRLRQGSGRLGTTPAMPA